MPENFVPPAFKVTGFHCPHCNTFAHQDWGQGRMAPHPTTAPPIYGLELSMCFHCKKYALWIGTKMVYPIMSIAPLASEDMPDNVKEDYNEARNVVNQSSRSAAALLRLALQKLMIHLGEKGKDLNSDIGSLVKKGLPNKIQEALDSLRVIGNNAVHPGQIDLKDDQDTANRLFEILNLIIQLTITKDREISVLYSKLPDTVIEQIKLRDAKKEGTEKKP